MSAAEQLAITGYAIASPLSNDLENFWQGLCHGPTPLRRWSSNRSFPGVSASAAWLTDFFPDADPPERVHLLAHDLIGRTLANGGFTKPPPNCGLAIGSHWAECDIVSQRPRMPPLPLVTSLAQNFAFAGPVVNLPVACAAANTAITWASQRLRRGEVDFMLAGGFDVIGPMAVSAFQFFDNLTETLPRPFAVNRDGFLLGEGGALFLLEPLAQARRQGRKIYGELCGVASAHDATHPTRPAADGRGLKRALRGALGDAGLTASAIGYINAHSPGTFQNDPAEAETYREIFGAHGVAVSSTKGCLGHAQGGANALELAACVLALEHQCLPPTLNVDAPDPSFEIDLVTGGPRPAALRYALSSASSMGGANSVVIVGRGEP